MQDGDAATLVIFGATGDLARRKIFPALFSLHSDHQLDPRMMFVGMAMDELDAKGFTRLVSEALHAANPYNRPEAVEAFLSRLSYLSSKAPGAYAQLAALLKKIEAKTKVLNQAYYCATPASAFPSIVESLAGEGLLDPGLPGWRRAVAGANR